MMEGLTEKGMLESLLVGGEGPHRGGERVSERALRLDLPAPEKKGPWRPVGLQPRGEGKSGRSRGQTSYRQGTFANQVGPGARVRTLASVISNQDWFGEMGF